MTSMNENRKKNRKKKQKTDIQFIPNTVLICIDTFLLQGIEKLPGRHLGSLAIVLSQVHAQRPRSLTHSSIIL